MTNREEILERQNAILLKRNAELEKQLAASKYDEDELRQRVLKGLQLYFDHHKKAERRNIGSIWKRINKFL